jgi:hypothetical protein
MKKDDGAKDEQRLSQEKQPKNEHLRADAQRLLREQRDLARITTFGRRDE